MEPKKMTVAEFQKDLALLTKNQKLLFDKFKEETWGDNRGLTPESTKGVYSSSAAGKNALHRLQFLGFIYLDPRTKRFKLRPVDLRP